MSQSPVFTTTITTTVRTTTPIPADAKDLTVDAAIEKFGPNPWLDRLSRAGVGDYFVGAVTDRAWTICRQLSVGGDYDLIIDDLSLPGPRAKTIAIYQAAVGFLCEPPAGAPPGLP
ncbi:hypothetical protein [Mycolicibacterium sp. S3B2]|uniref:hypothetical protein n=1 Tax=Mycolicibacterium sp. S3B2 TaxID=3415120 RepID=UPI003C7A8892